MAFYVHKDNLKIVKDGMGVYSLDNAGALKYLSDVGITLKDDTYLDVSKVVSNYGATEAGVKAMSKNNLPNMFNVGKKGDSTNLFTGFMSKDVDFKDVAFYEVVMEISGIVDKYENLPIRVVLPGTRPHLNVTHFIEGGTDDFVDGYIRRTNGCIYIGGSGKTDYNADTNGITPIRLIVAIQAAGGGGGGGGDNSGWFTGRHGGGGGYGGANSISAIHLGNGDEFCWYYCIGANGKGGSEGKSGGHAGDSFIQYYDMKSGKKIDKNVLVSYGGPGAYSSGQAANIGGHSYSRWRDDNYGTSKSDPPIRAIYDIYGGGGGHGDNVPNYTHTGGGSSYPSNVGDMSILLISPTKIRGEGTHWNDPVTNGNCQDRGYDSRVKFSSPGMKSHAGGAANNGGGGGGGSAWGKGASGDTSATKWYYGAGGGGGDKEGAGGDGALGEIVIFY